MIGCRRPRLSASAPKLLVRASLPNKSPSSWARSSSDSAQSNHNTTTPPHPRHRQEHARLPPPCSPFAFAVDSPSTACHPRLRLAASMNVINQNFAPPPHLLNNRLSPSRNSTSPGCSQRNLCSPLADTRFPVVFSPPTMSGRKRKADDDGSSGGDDDRMSASPSGSPAVQTRPLPRHSTKRMRTNVSGRPLPLPRLLETLSADEMRSMLQQICERHPDIGHEVVTAAPRPSVQSTLEVLGKYESAFQSAFPFGGRPSSDYAYNRVRQQLVELLESLKDFTPHFLPPNESQAATSLTFLDGATDFIHRLPEF